MNPIYNSYKEFKDTLTNTGLIKVWIKAGEGYGPMLHTCAWYAGELYIVEFYDDDPDKAASMIHADLKLKFPHIEYFYSLDPSPEMENKVLLDKRTETKKRIAEQKDTVNNTKQWLKQEEELLETLQQELENLY